MINLTLAIMFSLVYLLVSLPYTYNMIAHVLPNYPVLSNITNTPTVFGMFIQSFIFFVICYFILYKKNNTNTKLDNS